MIAYQDFVPQQISPGNILCRAEYESFDAAVAAANAWIQQYSVKVLNIETVVLPNLWSSYTQGTVDANISSLGDVGRWNQFVRVWYEQP